MKRLGLKGAIASRKPSGLDPDDLGPLETHEDAKRWLEAVGRAVLGGTLTERAAQAGIRAIEGWLRAEGERVSMQVVEELKEEVERLKAVLPKGSTLRTAM